MELACMLSLVKEILLMCWANIVGSYNLSQNLLRQTRKTASYLKPQAIEISFKRAYSEVEDNIIIYIEILKT